MKLGYNVKVRRTVSIDKRDIETLKPLLDLNGNNLSLALRQLIDEYRQKTNHNKFSEDQQKMMMLRNQIIEKRVAALVPVPLIKWLIKCTMGVPPLGTFRVIMEKYVKLIGIDSLSIHDYARMVNAHGDIFGYQISQHVEVGSDSRNMRITFEGDDSDNLKGSVVHYSCMLAHNPLRLKTKKVVASPNLIIVEYEQGSSEEEAFRSVANHFGYNQFIMEEIQNNLPFWKNAVNILKADHYEDIIISRDIFSQLRNSCDFSDSLNNLISLIYGVSIEDASYQDIIRFVEEICKTNGLIHRLEYGENELRVYHKFNDKDIIRAVNDTIMKTLRTSGQNFMLKKGDKVTVLHRK